MSVSCIIQAVAYLIVGVVLVAVFTSPMIDIITALGDKVRQAEYDV